MFVIKFKNILFVLSGIFLLAAMIITAALLLVNNTKPAIGYISAGRPVAVIDPGHGGVDGGAVSVTGVYESNINLQIAKKTEALFAFYGINTVMTRTEDISIHSPGSETIRAKKVSDLKNRVALINSYPDAVLFSIHQNTFSDSKYHGAQVFFRPDDASKTLAGITQTYLRDALSQGELNRKAAKIPSGVYLMKNVNITGVLIECGFLTNHAEEALLRDDIYQRKISQAIVASYIKFYSGREELEG